MTHYNVLRILGGAPNGLPTLQIRRRMVEEAAGITRLVDRLAADGLVERDRQSDDRRTVLCRITRKGLKLLERSDESIADAHSAVLGQLSAGEATELVRLLLKAVASIRATNGK